MSYFATNKRPSKYVGRILFPGLLCLQLSSGLMATTTAIASAAPAWIAAKPDPDTLLIEIYKDLSSNNLRQAQIKADKLVAVYPNFRLGHLIRGDLLLMHTRAVKTFGAAKDAPTDKLKDLREEAIARLNALRARPDPNLVPRSVLQLRNDQKHVLVVDTKRSRLYVYQNQDSQLKLLSDYYVSQGKLGVNKLKEGDQKTPIGIYYITGRLSKARLPDFYGSGALPINYPNEWDKINGRNGSGIWLHGTSSDSFSRPPLASDGCVVLNNQDLQQLFSSVEIGKTPVVISEQVEFINKKKWDVERNFATKLTESWRVATESMNTNRLLDSYSQQFKSESGENLKTWFAKNQQSSVGTMGQTITLRDVSLFHYPGKSDMIVGTFTLDTQTGKSKKSLRKRQYWAKEGSQWKIVYEGNI